MSHIMGVSQFEHFFRQAASLDVDKSDLKRMSDFLNKKIHDLLLMAQAKSKANEAPVIRYIDLPLTKGLQESMHQFHKLDVALEVEPILQQLEKLPPMDLEYEDELVQKLPDILGGMTYALARTFKIVDPSLKNPQTKDWDKVEAIFDLLV
ncbi:DUF1931 family protein [Sulfurivirga sp.]|uniref:DUF1931 family protein n=1 Tax=Sulfurivirga sp. TaxID=2614236 RepID=UPI0025DEF93D|nr:DUF1931 family protein [Sulfurivirga sp.]